MPVQPTYPGVYIEEIASGVRTITGVSTSITAFIGRALTGPVNEAVTITSFADYERWFGGLWAESMMSYAVQDFYQNGGSEAVIVRIYKPADTTKDGIAIIKLAGPTIPAGAEPLTLQAVSPGDWGNQLFAAVNYNTQDPTAAAPATGDTDLFNLVIYEQKGGQVTKVEEYLRVSLKSSDIRFLPRMLQQQSARVLVTQSGTGDWKVPDTRPDKTAVDGKGDPVPIAATGGLDGSTPAKADYTGSESEKTGIYALLKTDLFNLLCIPPPARGQDTDPAVYAAAATLCTARRALLLVDAPAAWGSSVAKAVSEPVAKLSSLLISGTYARNAALYYPLIRKADPKRNNQLETFVPCGAIAGIMARTDTSRGVWKAPAGTDAAMNGVQRLQINLSDLENGQLNKLGINCLRTFPLTGSVVWGARTMRGADQLADEWKYIPVRRTALFIEETLYRATQWVVFEPNDESLWAQIRLNVGAFMHNLFRQGAFQGKTPKEAYLVKCDRETTTQNDINAGIVNVLVGFAPLKPAEFVIIKIQQLAGEIES